MKVTWLCGVCLVSCLVKVSLSCSCFPIHLQTDVCNADLAIKGTVLSVEDYDQYTLRYNVSVEKNFKTGMPTPNSVISVLTGDNSALCGVRYTIGETYLIVGNTYMGEYRTNICSWNLEFSALSKFQLFALNTKLYLNNCGCEIFHCYYEECDSEADCLIGRHGDNVFCYNVNAACTKRGSNCSWTTNTCSL
ncbi:metalloproteinase inhibitor 3-like [Crassostrea virginica]